MALTRVAALALCLLGLVAAGCGSEASGPEGAGESASAGRVVDLDGVDTLRTAFVDGAGSARLVLLLSPT